MELTDVTTQQQQRKLSLKKYYLRYGKDLLGFGRWANILDYKND
jgi:hypothetical protein